MHYTRITLLDQPFEFSRPIRNRLWSGWPKTLLHGNYKYIRTYMQNSGVGVRVKFTNEIFLRANFFDTKTQYWCQDGAIYLYSGVPTSSEIDITVQSVKQNQLWNGPSKVPKEATWGGHYLFLKYFSHPFFSTKRRHMALKICMGT